MGKGQVRFFYDKGKYTLNRYLSLYAEAGKRGFNVINFSEAWIGYPENLMKDYIETEENRRLLLDRIEKEKGFKLNK